ncbi:MAG: glycosyltransferase family 2 protein [Bacteroidota bacterium]
MRQGKFPWLFYFTHSSTKRAMQEAGVTIVILNYNGRDWLEKFLPSVIQTTYQSHRILVVDNASTDDSISFVQAQFPDIDLLELPENYGFAEGNNRAIPHIHTPYFVLLNSDVEVTPDWLGPLVARMEAQPQIAALQPKIRAYKQQTHFEYAGAAGGFIDKWGYPFCRGRIFDVLEEDQGQYEEALPILWATGACCMIRTEVVQKIGLFDGDFFAHMEEIDFCWRAINHGYEIYCEPASVVYHVGGGTLPQGNPRKTFLNARNSLFCLYKNSPSQQTVGKILTRLLLDGVWGARALLQGDVKTIGAILKAHGAFYRGLGHYRKLKKEIYPQGITAVPSQGYYPKSIVWDHFISGKKKWSELFP